MGSYAQIEQVWNEWQASHVPPEHLPMWHPSQKAVAVDAPQRAAAVSITQDEAQNAVLAHLVVDAHRRNVRDGLVWQFFVGFAVLYVVMNYRRQ